MGITIPIDRSVQLASNVRRALVILFFFFAINALVIRFQVDVNYGFFLLLLTIFCASCGGHEAYT
jgi:hypothetical protein